MLWRFVTIELLSNIDIHAGVIYGGKLDKKRENYLNLFALLYLLSFPYIHIKSTRRVSLMPTHSDNQNVFKTISSPS